MQLQVIGSNIKGYAIQGKVIPGGKVVIRHRGKVKRGYIVRTKAYNPFMVSYDKPAIVILAEVKRIKGPIIKGVMPEIRALAQKQY
jgi:ribosomal protein L14